MFAFRLALALGVWDVDGLLQTMPLRLFREWEEFCEIDDFTQARADWRSGMIANVIANCHSTDDKSKLKISDFMPYQQKNREEKPAIGIGQALLARFGKAS